MTLSGPTRWARADDHKYFGRHSKSASILRIHLRLRPRAPTDREPIPPYIPLQFVREPAGIAALPGVHHVIDLPRQFAGLFEIDIKYSA